MEYVLLIIGFLAWCAWKAKKQASETEHRNHLSPHETFERIIERDNPELAYIRQSRRDFHQERGRKLAELKPMLKELRQSFAELALREDVPTSAFKKQWKKHLTQLDLFYGSDTVDSALRDLGFRRGSV